MGANPRTKGQGGEREVATAFNGVINEALVHLGIPLPPVPMVQRNQNQSAVGGSDLSNTFGLAVEVKRQEALSVNTWWKQCVASAERNKEIPVLVYRQNKLKWRVVMFVDVPLAHGLHQSKVRAELDWESFLTWYFAYVVMKLRAGAPPTV